MEEKLKVITNVMQGLVKINGWVVDRFDIHRYSFPSAGISGYSGFLYITDRGVVREFLIHGNGEIEELKEVTT